MTRGWAASTIAAMTRQRFLRTASAVAALGGAAWVTKVAVLAATDGDDSLVVDLLYLCGMLGITLGASWVGVWLAGERPLLLVVLLGALGPLLAFVVYDGLLDPFAKAALGDAGPAWFPERGPWTLRAHARRMCPTRAPGRGSFPLTTTRPQEGSAVMFSIALSRPLAAIAVVGGLLIAAAPASANVESPKDPLSGIPARHASGDGTSNTVMFAAVSEADGDEVLTYAPQTPSADGIIAILIG